MACTAAVGIGVAVGTPPLATWGVVALGAVVDAGTDVGVVEPPLDSGVAVAEDPQANNRATNSRTIALGRCLINRGFNLDISRGSPILLCVTNC